MQNSDWSDFLYAACLIAVIFFVVGTIMLVLYVIRVICTSASVATQDIESGARSEGAISETRSERSQTLRSVKSLSSGRTGSIRSRRSRRSETRPSQRSTSLSQSEREKEPGSRRSTSLRNIPLRSAQGSRGQTLNVVLKKKEVKFSKTEHSSEEDEAVPDNTQIKGVEIPKQTIKAGAHEEDEVVSRTKGPVGINIPKETIKAGVADDDEKDEIAPKGIKGIDIPRETLRSGAAGERHVTKPKAAPSITFNVEPGASISVNVLSRRAYAGGGENERFCDFDKNLGLYSERQKLCCYHFF
ncbi:unnamed protein product [Cylicocyclus nassatus]|uniref:Uncharacterized protein n=1 Tax=Cylicocyclus nassatus TaxID=53992 RepID=A0AA36GRJ6_CYLNA|nr:unnamed protein product [Cylicocyclus nassatus]